MALLSNTEFLQAASELFTKSQDTRSSVYLTLKRLTVHDEVVGNADARNEISQFSEDGPVLKKSKLTKSSTEKSYPLLIRITDGNSDKAKKQKFSTQVQPEHLSKFWKEYSTVIKSGAVGLSKKKDKSKKKKKVSAN